MTTLREAAQQALEAMESADFDPHSSDAIYKAIIALKAALAEPAQEPAWCEIHQHHKWCEHNGGVMGPTGWEKP